MKKFNVATDKNMKVNLILIIMYDIEKLKEKTEDRLDIRVGASLRYLNASMEFKAENGDIKSKNTAEGFFLSIGVMF